MKSTIPLAGEAMAAKPTDDFHALVISASHAQATFNAALSEDESAEITGALNDALNAIRETDLVATTYEGAIGALRAASAEIVEFGGSDLVKSLLRGALGYFSVCEAEHPWTRVRRLSRQLSAELENCDDGQWYVNIMPPGEAFRHGFGSSETGAPVDRVNRFAWELAEALNDYQGGRFKACVYPSNQAGYSVLFVPTKAAPKEHRTKKMSAIYDIVSQVRGQFKEPDNQIYDVLYELASWFAAAAKLVDPTITNASYFRDGDHLDQFSGVSFERKDGGRVD